MAVIAVVAFALTGRILWQRSLQFEQLAAFQEMVERRWREVELSHPGQADAIRDDRAGHRERMKNGTAILNERQYEAWLEEHLSMARESRAQAAYHSRLKNAYRAVSRRPWTSPSGLAGD
jgi:hypothetical protein